MINEYEQDLVNFIRARGYSCLSDEELVYYYQMYSEEQWSSQWEDNVEELFLQWLKDKNLFKENKNDS